MGDFKAKSVCSSRRWNGKTVWDGFSRGAKSLPDFGNKMGCSSSFPVVWCLRIGAGLNPILSPALPTRSSSAPGANLPPGNPRPGCGREVWVERQRDCYNLHFFLANFKQTFGQSSQLQLENSRCLRRGAARSCRSRATCPQQTPRLPPGIVLPPVSQLSAGTDRAGRV